MRSWTPARWAYEMGLNDGLIVRKQIDNPGGEVDFELGEQGISDVQLDEEDK